VKPQQPARRSSDRPHYVGEQILVTQQLLAQLVLSRRACLLCLPRGLQCLVARIPSPIHFSELTMAPSPLYGGSEAPHVFDVHSVVDLLPRSHRGDAIFESFRIDVDASAAQQCSHDIAWG
jgi:hypothetical protein